MRVIKDGQIAQDVADLLNGEAKTTGLTFETMGRRVTIIAVFGSADEANEFMAATPNASVIAAADVALPTGTDGTLVFIADKNDRGVKVS